MANPFYVEPANPLSALMAGQQGYDQGQKRMASNAIEGAAPALAAGDYKNAIAQIMAGGGQNLQAVLGVAGLEHQKTADERAAAQLTETTRHNKRIEGLTESHQSDPVFHMNVNPLTGEKYAGMFDPKARTFTAFPQQATQGLISAVPDTGPMAGQNIAPQINAAAPAPAPPRPRNDMLFNSLPPDMQGKVREIENNPEALHNYQGKDQQLVERIMRNVNPGWERPAPGWTPEATAINVRRMYNGDYSPLVNAGRGTQAGRTLEKAWNGLAEYMIREKGFTPDEAAQILSLRKQEYAAQGAGLAAGARTEGTREKNLEIVLKVADAAIPAALEAAREVWRTGFVPLNKMVSATGTLITSNPAERKFGMANLQLAEHWARAMNPNGVMRESDRDKALEYLSNKGDSYGTYEQAVRQLKTQIDREYEGVRKHEPSRSDQFIAEIGKVAGGGGGTPPPPPTRSGGIPPPSAQAQPPPQAIEFLRANPRAAEAFDAKYGTGMAAKVLGGQ